MVHSNKVYLSAKCRNERVLDKESMQNICRIATFVVLCSCPGRILALEHRTDWTFIAEMLGSQKKCGPIFKIKAWTNI